MTLLFLSAKEVKAVKYAYQYMIVTTAGYSLLTLVNTVRFTIQGMGYSAIAILAGVFEMAARTLAGTLVVSMIGFMGVCMANDLAWIFADAFLIPVFLYYIEELRKISMICCIWMREECVNDRCIKGREKVMLIKLYLQEAVQRAFLVAVVYIVLKGIYLAMMKRKCISAKKYCIVLH